MHRRRPDRGREAQALTSAADLAGMGGSEVLAGSLDVSRIRESTRRGRLWRLLSSLVPLTAYLYYRILSGQTHPPRAARTSRPSDGPDPVCRSA